VVNDGTAAVPADVLLETWLVTGTGEALLRTDTLSGPIEPGTRAASIALEFPWSTILDGALSFRIDPAPDGRYGEVIECDEEDNRLLWTPPFCQP
jgi:hypothetical protein